MKKNGFTLVELLAVIVLLAILMAIAVPNALKLNSKVNRKGYMTKIELIEDAADSYGLSNLSFVRQGKNPLSGAYSICTFNYSGDDVTSINVLNQSSYNADRTMTNTATKKEYWCFQMTVADLVKTNNLDWDYTSQCDGKCTDDNKENYDNIVINPASKNIINKCFVYVYYRNNRVYSYYDINECDKYSEIPTNGKEYRQLRV
ncbi:MAG: prepilin-type N-terminal cleavage/methylation domain-containing protein [Erysipelotrichales bacterium]|nr:prepilin-type N-terminal cleavage/methylation domain-containing protein [Erysipelotrichales bacterium]